MTDWDRGRTNDPSPRAARQTGSSAGGRPLAVRSILRLQASAGNAAVARALARARPARVGGRQVSVQRFAIPPPAPAPSAPTEDAGFRDVTGQVRAAEHAFRAHPPASREARAAQAAARPPVGDKQAHANTAQAGAMAAAKASAFDKAAFIDAVTRHVAFGAPKTAEEADGLATSGNAVTIPAAVIGEVTTSKDAAAKPLTDATAASPDTSKTIEKSVHELPPQPDAPAPAVDAERAVPSPAPAAQTDFSAGSADLAQQMGGHDITDEQLAEANEPQFSAALAAKQKQGEHAARAPGEVRQHEATQLNAARDGARALAQASVASMGARTQRSAAGRTARQLTAKSSDESARADVATHVNDVFGKTKSDVDAILRQLGDTVPKVFDGLETIARVNFTFEYRGRLEAYKDERHSGWFGWARAIDDAATGLPKEVEDIYNGAKAHYLQAMQKAISDIADFVARELTRAKQRIESGRAEIATYLGGLKPALREIGAEAATDIGEQFDELETSGANTTTDLAAELAERYVECTTAVTAEISQAQQEDQGLLADAYDFAAGVWNTVDQLKDLLLEVLSRWVHAVTSIIRHPIRFFESFVKSVGQGVSDFVADLGSELREGLMTWLFGKLPGNLELPDELDARGLIKLVLSLLGLTWEQIKQEILGFVPEPVRALVLESVQALAAAGPAGLVERVVQRAGDVVDAARVKMWDYVESTIIGAGIDKLKILLGPVSAFVEACKLIYRAFKWLADNLTRLKSLVELVFDTVDSIANAETDEAVPGVAEKVKTGLSATIPVLIDGLAEMLGLGDVVARIHSMLDVVKRPIKAVKDKIVRTAVKYGRGLARKLMPRTARKAGRTGPDNRTASEKGRAVHSARLAVEAAMKASGATLQSVRAAIPGIRARHTVSTIELLSDDGRRYHADVKLNPEELTDTVALTASEIPKKRYLPKYLLQKKRVRTRLYISGGAWQTIRQMVVRHAVDHFMPLVDLIAHGFLSRAEARAEIAKNVQAGLLPRSAIAAYERRRFNARFVESIPYHVDHVRSIAEHWVDRGYTTSDAARRGHASAVDNLAWVTREFNLEKGSRGEDDDRPKYGERNYVTEEFTSAQESADRKRIAGRPYLDENGRPLA